MMLADRPVKLSFRAFLGSNLRGNCRITATYSTNKPTIMPKLSNAREHPTILLRS